MRVLLVFFIGFICLATSAWGLGYSCRDEKGTKYFVDSPSRLPNSCKGKIWQFEQPVFFDDATSTTKSAPQTKRNKNLFKQMIEEDSLARKFGQLKQQATIAVEKYKQGTELLSVPQRSRHSGIRGRMGKGQKLISDAQQSKQNILNDLEILHFSTQKQMDIEKQLDHIR